ncbi:ATP-dependent DNA ligase [Granulosicoccus antarcticus]|uniref:DNA ligase (ATP) n=1 Tax=Granulosicoccus antarcticus IMCC3135 TaxID=1192854 RepID=A0A2Z2NRJ2_9GAMM|nr:ATP-dependent DNA ligase [Granulosicoccus antarcticus]ASJ72358.1 DNA ligase B [Granulosicoccus antarcticus IMCC3135]
MQAFSTLYQTLDQTTSTNAKVAAMVSYFDKASARDAAWTVYFLSGRRVKRLVGSALLREWLRQECDLPEWLVDDAYASVGDLAETIALLVAKPGKSLESRSLADWIEQGLLSLRNQDSEQQRKKVVQWWHQQSYEQCYIINKLMTGALRVGVSQILLARAVAAHADLPRALVLHRLMGEWTPDEKFWQSLIDEDSGETVSSRPYPFCLASPLEKETESLGPVEEWIAEWKWDGIRAQLIRRQSQTYLWSRGEELIGARFPEITDVAEQLPEGTVLDGEILAWNDDGVMPFSELQKRIGRKTVGKKLLHDVPCLFLAYDMMEYEGKDIRNLSLSKRRELLTSMIGSLSPSKMQMSNALEARSWAELARQREQSRERQVEGLMLKHVDATYQTGRKRGFWWKWKVEPYTIDAVMLYAQAGHGKRANLFTDYTFGVWQEGVLVPVAKAYSGLDNSEINALDKWIRRNTIERFGPVRSVASEQVFELAFEGINLSTRHKSGIAVRFPRIARWRKDLAPADADTLDDIKRLINQPSPDSKT